MALVWFLICAYRPNRYLTGLESPLHAAMIWTIVLQYMRIRRLSPLARSPHRRSSSSVVLLVLNTWTAAGQLWPVGIVSDSAAVDD